MSESPQMFVPFQPKTETRKGGRFEDVQRPNQQTFMHGSMRFVQIMLVMIAAWSWAKVAQAYRSEPITGDMAELISGAIWVMTLALIGVVTAKILSMVDADRMSTLLITAALLIVWLLFNLIVAPVAVFAMLMVERDLVYILPLLATAAAAAFVPSLEVGRLSFWKELVDQSGTNSEKPVVDQTAIDLKQMELDWQREQSEANEAALNSEIARLNALLKQPQVIDPEPSIGGRKSIEDCIRPVKMNGHWEYQALTRNGPRRLDATLLMQFVIEAWAHNQFKRKYWLERGIKRDDWEAMAGAVAFAFDEQGRVIRGVDDVISELMRYGVITPAIYPTAPLENGLSQSRPYGTDAGTGTIGAKSGAGG